MPGERCVLRRQVLEVPGVTHGSAPIPMGVKIGPFIFSSAIMGYDPEARAMPNDPARQTELCFQHLQTLLANAGASSEHVAKMTVYIKDNAMRQHVNEQWLKMFPEERDRPVRHTIVMDLAGGMLVQIEVIAVLSSREEDSIRW